MRLSSSHPTPWTMSICRGLLVCASLESILIVGGRESIHVPVGIWLFVSTYTIAVELVSMHVPLFLAGISASLRASLGSFPSLELLADGRVIFVMKVCIHALKQR